MDIRAGFRKLGWLAGRSRKHVEIEEELAFHLREEAEERQAEGLSAEQAKSAARRELGNVALLMEDTRAAWGWTAWERLWQDLHYAARMLRKNQGFTAAAVLSLALGIGANTAIFTMVNAILLEALPYPEPNRLVVLWAVPDEHPDQMSAASVPEYYAWKEQSHSFETVGVFRDVEHDLGAEDNGTNESGAGAERVVGENLTADTFQVLSVKPLLGRVFTQDENRVGAAAPVVLISRRLWQRRYAGDPNILGRTIRVDGGAKTIIGVMPHGFGFVSDQAEIWAPTNFNQAQLQGSGRGWDVAARLKPGVTIQQAQAEMDSIAARVAKDFPINNQGWGVRVQPMHDAIFGGYREPFLILEGVVLFVLLIACANVAALLLARAASRRTELAVRAAIGASRGRLVRQFLTESVLLGMAGGAAGVLVAWAGLQLLVSNGPSWFPRLHDLTINARVLGFTAFVSTLTGLIFGVVPAMQASKEHPGVHGGVKGGLVRHRLRGALVVVQIALALILLMGSGLLINSFLRLKANDLGADPHNLLTFQFRIRNEGYGYMKQVGSHHGYPLVEISPVPALKFGRVLEKLQHLPGALSVAGTNHAPFSGETFTRTFSIEGKPAPQSATYFMVTPNYFATMRIPLLRGRDIDAKDASDSPWVAIVNETMARTFWPNEDPIGKHLTVDLVEDEQPREIIAVARDSRLDSYQQNQQPILYVAYNQQPPHSRGPYGGDRMTMAFVLRAAEDPAVLISALRRAVAEVDPGQPFTEIQTVEQSLTQQLEEPRYYMILMGAFAAVAMLLAAAGIYGVMSYMVAQRTHEIGVRMALGANGGDVFRLVLRQGLTLVSLGLAGGLAGSFALTPRIASFLWGVKATDPLTFASVSLALAAVSLSACLLPTRKAVRVDPTVALRHE